MLDAHEVELYRYLRRLSPTAEDAADLHQETFLRAYRAYSALPPDANVRAWLYRIATNLAHDAHRRRQTRTRALGHNLRARDDSALSPADGSERAPSEPSAGRDTDPQARAEATELRGAVREALLSLTARQRTAVIGRVFEELDYPAVAELLGCSQVTARQHVHQGLQRLRALLAGTLEVPA